MKHVLSSLTKSELSLSVSPGSSEGVGWLDDLDGLGQLLSKEWADGDIIQQRIATLLLV